MGLILAAPVTADVSFEEMMHQRPLQGRSLTPEALAAAQRQLEEDRAAELAEQQRLAQEEARLAAEALSRRAAMPLGARLVEDRCTLCHPPEVVAAVRHAWPGWAFTVARMRYWHGALPPGPAKRPAGRVLRLIGRGGPCAGCQDIGQSPARPRSWVPALTSE